MTTDEALAALSKAQEDQIKIWRQVMAARLQIAPLEAQLVAANYALTNAQLALTSATCAEVSAMPDELQPYLMGPRSMAEKHST